MGIGIGGLISGLDTESIISQMMSIEQRPIIALQQDEAFYQSKISALGTLRSGLSSLQSTVSALKNEDNFKAFSVSSGNSEVLTLTASTSATTGTYQVEVTGLAQSQQVRSSSFTSGDDVVGTGTISIQVGSGTAVDVTIDSSNDTLSEIATAINDADTDVNATAVNDGSGNYYLTLLSKENGSANTINVTVTDDDANNDDASGLSSLYTTPASHTMTETQTASNAELTVNGIAIVRTENIIDDLIDGVTITLKAEDTGNPFTVSVSENHAAVSTKIQAFVDSYNELATTLADLQEYDSETGEAAALQGDGTTRALQKKLQNLVYNEIEGIDSAVNSLSKLGIEQESDGQLTFTSSTFETALGDYSDDVINFFTKENTDEDGIAVQYYDILESYIASDGLIAAKESGFNASIEDINDQIDRINVRLTKKEETLRQQFENLELLLSNFELTQNSLEGQLQSITNLNSQINK